MKADLILNDPISGTFCTSRPQPTTANEGVSSAGKEWIVLHPVRLPHCELLLQTLVDRCICPWPADQTCDLRVTPERVRVRCVDVVPPGEAESRGWQR